jgi:hypothetical protein
MSTTRGPWPVIPRDWTRAFAVVSYEQAVEPFKTIGSMSDGSLFLTLPTRALTGQQIISSEG